MPQVGVTANVLLLQPRVDGNGREIAFHLSRATKHQWSLEDILPNPVVTALGFQPPLAFNGLNPKETLALHSFCTTKPAPPNPFPSSSSLR